MNSRPALRQFLSLLGALVLLGAIAFFGYGLIQTRAAGSGTSQALAPLPPRPKPLPSASATEAPAQRWLVAKATQPLIAYVKPDENSKVRATLDKVTLTGSPMVLLVHQVKDVGGATWYYVSLPVPPNGSRGWIKQGGVSIYAVTTRIVVDLSARTLTVWDSGAIVGTYPVAVGMPSLPTPTGSFYINLKLRPSDPGGVYGPLALGTSAFQPKLSSWPGGGIVGIHGTNEDSLIGKAVSHGCIRMHNRDIKKVDDVVIVGSPLLIQK